MTKFRHVACVLLAAAVIFTSPAYATSFSTDQSDLWYIPAESGWGMQLVQRGDVIFATLFVYGPDTSPTWYTATMDPTGTAFQWSGTLYATMGPWFGTIPFNPALVTITPVGTMTWDGSLIDSGVVTYSVNGVVVTKDVVRQTLVLDDFSGHYGGIAHRDVTNCANPIYDGTTELAGIFDITQSGDAITTISTGTQGSCTYIGTLSEAGQMGSSQSSFSCTDGSVGVANFFEMQVTISGITGRFALTYSNPPGCQSTGWFGGGRGTTF